MIRPIRVLWLIKGLGPGGAERLLVSSAEARDRAAVDVEVGYVLPHKSELASDFENLGIPVHCLRGDRDIDVRWGGRLRRLLQERRYEIVHVHSPYVAAVTRVVARSLPSARRPRLVYTEHLPWFGYRPATRVLNAATYPLDDVQLAVSKAVVDSVPRRFARRLRVMHQGIDVQAERAAIAERDAARVELGVRPHDLVIGTVANYREQKDYPNLFAAARRVLAESSNVRFVAIGQGPQESEVMAAYSAESFGDRFQLLGRREDVSHVLAACDLFVLASKNEGLPIALVEALALGLPVVATAVGGTPEVVTDGLEGLLVPPSNPEQLASAIGRLAVDPELRARMSAAATERSGHFEISRAVGETEAIYRALTFDSR